MSDWTIEVLSRPPVMISDDTTVDALSAEFAERLEALLLLHNGLEPSLEGWRDLALALALEHEPAFKIETPADRVGRSGKEGRPVGWTGLAMKSAMRAEMRKGKTQTKAAEAVAPRFTSDRTHTAGKYSPGTFENLMKRLVTPDASGAHPMRTRQ